MDIESELPGRATDGQLMQHPVRGALQPIRFPHRSDRLARFEHEARTVARLNHPNIVTLFSIQDVDGNRFLTVELVQGQSLDRQIAPGGAPGPRVVDWGVAMADALGSAHAQGSPSSIVM